MVFTLYRLWYFHLENVTGFKCSDLGHCHSPHADLTTGGVRSITKLQQCKVISLFSALCWFLSEF